MGQVPLVMQLSQDMELIFCTEMTNLYMSAWPNDPIIRGAIMQSSDSKNYKTLPAGPSDPFE